MAITLYAELPIVPPKSMTVAKASVALSAQDIGPWPPNTMLVFAATGARIFVVTSDLEDQIERVPACDVQWEDFKDKYRQALSALRSSGTPERKAMANAMQYEEKGFEACRRCYGRALPGQQAFMELTRRAQAIVDRLQGN